MACGKLHLSKTYSSNTILDIIYFYDIMTIDKYDIITIDKIVGV